MESAIISAESKKDLQLLISIAEKMGVKAKFLSKEEMEDYAMANAIKEGETGEFVDTNAFLSSLK